MSPEALDAVEHGDRGGEPTETADATGVAEVSHLAEVA